MGPGPAISDITNETKLKFYALYKQATSGPNKEKQPSRLNIVARMKW
jgi:acyl-CoA-binding protein